MQPDDLGGAGTWLLRRCRLGGDGGELSGDPVLAGLPSLSELAERNGTVAGQEFLINTDGRVVREVNAFFSRRGGCGIGRRRRGRNTRAVCVFGWGIWTRSAGRGTRPARGMSYYYTRYCLK
jgi:hypothetical protein